MIDTIVLTLNPRQFHILEPDKFIPSAVQVLNLRQSSNAPYISCLQNASVKEKKEGIYKPKLTLTRRKAGLRYAITLKIEFSAPKLLLSNNFDELTQKNFPALVRRLVDILASMGVKISPYCIKNANISAIHYSKNIILDDYVSSTMILSELAHADMTKRLDVNKTDFRNGGHALKWHANSHEITFYDKITDMRQAKISEKRAVEHESAIQMDLFLKYIAPESYEVLRMEARLNTRAKIKDILGKVNCIRNMTFERMYNEDLSREIILYYWAVIKKGLPIIDLMMVRPEDIYLEIKRNNPGMKPAKVSRLVGIKLIMDSVGLTGLKSLMYENARSWQRLKQEIKQIKVPVQNKWKAILQLEKKLNEFKAIRIERGNV